MAIGPVQLLVLGFNQPDFRGEIIEELEKLRERDTVWAVPLREAIARAGGFRLADGFISPLDLVEMGVPSSIASFLLRVLRCITSISPAASLYTASESITRQQGRRPDRPRHRGRRGLREGRRGWRPSEPRANSCSLSLQVLAPGRRSDLGAGQRLERAWELTTTCATAEHAGPCRRCGWDAHRPNAVIRRGVVGAHPLPVSEVLSVDVGEARRPVDAATCGSIERTRPLRTRFHPVGAMLSGRRDASIG